MFTVLEMAVSTNGCTTSIIAMWPSAGMASAETKYSGNCSTLPPSSRYRRQAWSSTAYSLVLPSASRFLRL